MARQFSHPIGIAEEILAYNHKPKVEILIRRDAPELLKIRESRNGSKRAPWAPQLDFGWTVSGQMCLDWVGRSAHVSARRTAVCACQIGSKCRNVNIYVQISIFMSKSKNKCQYLPPLAIFVSTNYKNICPNQCMQLVLYCLVLMYFLHIYRSNYRSGSVDINLGV